MLAIIFTYGIYTDRGRKGDIYGRGNIREREYTRVGIYMERGHTLRGDIHIEGTERVTLEEETERGDPLGGEGAERVTD